jgi:hypothetical protein
VTRGKNLMVLISRRSSPPRERTRLGNRAEWRSAPEQRSRSNFLPVGSLAMEMRLGRERVLRTSKIEALIFLARIRPEIGVTVASPRPFWTKICNLSNLRGGKRTECEVERGTVDGTFRYASILLTPNYRLKIVPFGALALDQF